MKKINWFLLALFCLYACNSAKDASSSEEATTSVFTITGESQGAYEGPVYLQLYSDNGYETIDSSLVQEGKYSFTGTLETPQRYYLRFQDKEKLVAFFLDASEVQVYSHIDSLDDAVITGSASQDQYLAFEKELAGFDDIRTPLMKAYQAANEAGDKPQVEAIVAKFDSIREVETAFIKDYIHTNNESVVAAYLAYRHLSFDSDTEALGSLIDDLSADLDATPYVKSLKERLATLERVAIGQPATDFSLEDPDGNAIALSSLKGKYVLIDFWASWCGPCRRENPNVVALYNELHEKGFEILGVSFDSKHDKWVEAIADDNLTWPHVSDLKGWQSAAGKLYGVRSIPHTILLDPEGIIIAKDLRGDELRNKLEEVLSAG